MIKYLSAIIIISISACSAYSDEQIEIRYMGYQFYIPENPSIIATMGGNDSVLTIAYGLGDKKNLISFVNMDNDELVTALEANEECSYETFLNVVFTGEEYNTCDNQEVDVFKNVMIGNSSYGRFSSEIQDAYYVIGDEKSIIILNYEGKAKVNIESNYLSKEQLEQLVSNYL